MSKVSFSVNNPTFSQQLRLRVDAYFTQNKTKLTGNKKLYWKTAILLTSMAVLYGVLVFGGLPYWVGAILAVIMGINVAAIGFNVMHDGAHGSYSRKPWINELMARSLDFLGGCSFLWKAKHNINHHSFTNIDGIDDDIDNQPWIRTHANQPKRWFHKYQHVYWAVLYGLTYLSWVFFADFKKYFSGKISETRYKKMKTRDHVFFWLHKAVYISVFIALPAIMIGVIPTIIGYLIMSLVTGFILSIVFQLAHVVEDTSFPVPAAENGKVDQDWTVHQLATTSNFATKSKVVSWFAGGLNFQVEHHLFPRISHIHYPEINKIVKDVCKEFNVKYIEYGSMLTAVKSHIIHLKQTGVA